MERRLLQIVVALTGLVVVGAGFLGAVSGASFLHLSNNVAVDSYLRFLFGIVLAIGVVLLASVPHIERHGTRFSVLAAILVIGGVVRALGFFGQSIPTHGALFGLSLELIAAPLLWLWQRRVARHDERQRHT